MTPESIERSETPETEQPDAYYYRERIMLLERRLREAEEEAKRCHSNWTRLQDATGEQCLEVAIPLVESWKEASERREGTTFWVRRLALYGSPLKAFSDMVRVRLLDSAAEERKGG